MLIELPNVKASIEIESFEFVKTLNNKQLLDLIKDVCEETLVPIKEVRRIVNSDMYDI